MVWTFKIKNFKNLDKLLQRGDCIEEEEKKQKYMTVDLEEEKENECGGWFCWIRREENLGL